MAAPPPDNIVAEYNPFKKIREDILELGASVQPAAIRTLISAEFFALRDKVVMLESVWAHGFKQGYVRGVESTEVP